MYTFIKKYLRLELKSPYNVKSYVQPKVRKYVVNPSNPIPLSTLLRLFQTNDSYNDLRTPSLPFGIIN